MNFKEIDSATLEYQEKVLRRNKLINAVCHGILGMLISVVMLLMGAL